MLIPTPLMNSDIYTVEFHEEQHSHPTFGRTNSHSDGLSLIFLQTRLLILRRVEFGWAAAKIQWIVAWLALEGAECGGQLLILMFNATRLA